MYLSPFRWQQRGGVVVPLGALVRLDGKGEQLGTAGFCYSVAVQQSSIS